MDDVAANAARTVARALAGELGDQLPGDVEAILRARGDALVDQYVLDPISLAGLIVSAASFAWTVYRDLQTKSDAPAGHVIERRVRIELHDGELGGSPEQRDRIIESVVTEIMSSAPSSNDPQHLEQ